MKKAGYASGKYDGNEKLLMVASNQGTAPAVAQIAKEQFEKLGFKITLRLVTTNTMYTKFCSIPSANVASCPSAAWGKDFSDGQTMLDPVFNGDNISKQANNNYAELDVPGDQRQDGRGQAPDRPEGARGGVGRGRQADHGARRPACRGCGTSGRTSARPTSTAS